MIVKLLEVNDVHNLQAVECHRIGQDANFSAKDMSN